MHSHFLQSYSNFLFTLIDKRNTSTLYITTEYKYLSLKDSLAVAQNSMKQQAEQHHSERDFEVGDPLFLYFKPYK